MLINVWKFFRRLAWFAFAVLIVVFSIFNRGGVDLSLGPIGSIAGFPVYLVFFLGIFVGLVTAATVSGWLRLQGFAERRKAERRSRYLEGQVSALSEDAHKQRARRAHETASDTKAVAAPD